MKERNRCDQRQTEQDDLYKSALDQACFRSCRDETVLVRVLDRALELQPNTKHGQEIESKFFFFIFFGTEKAAW